MAKKSAREGAQASVEAWLAKTGYPLQMRVARRATTAFSGFRAVFVEQGNVFLNPLLNEAREVDVGIGIHGRLFQEVQVALAFSIECKNTQNPWVVFCEQDPAVDLRRYPDWITTRHSLVLYQVGLPQLNGKDTATEFAKKISTELPMLNSSTPCGNLIVEAYKEKASHDPAYNAMRQVLSATHAMVSEAVIKENPQQLPTIMYGVPVVVITSPVLVAYLQADGELATDEVPVATVRFSTAAETGEPGDSTLVTVVNEYHLELLIESMLQTYSNVAGCTKFGWMKAETS